MGKSKKSKIKENSNQQEKIKRSLFIDYNIKKDIPFLEETLQQINKLDQTKLNIKININNSLNKYNNAFFIKHLSNFKNNIINSTNYEKISKIVFEDIEFKCIDGSAMIENNKILSIKLSSKLLKRLKPIIEDETEILKVYIKDENKEYKISSKIYNTPSFLTENNQNNQENENNQKNNNNQINENKENLIKKAKEEKYDYYLYLDNYVFIDNPNMLNYLISTKKDLIAPVLSMAGGQPKCNFMSNMDQQQLIGILQNKLKGEWEVNEISNCYLIDLKKLDNNLNTKNLTKYVSNKEINGWIICDDLVIKDRAHPELYQYYVNRIIWHRVFLHPDFYNFMEKGQKINYIEPEECRDIFDWNCFTEKFCSYLINECEKYGEWSGGGNKDSRLSSGYENVPTRDIHLNQIGLGEMWKDFVVNYIGRVAGETFSKINTRGYNIAFVVRYTMDTQKELKPHHDASVHTTVTCLNTEFTGGGTHFVRQNYIHNPKKPGSTSIHPGRCTHYHEGLPITGGRRYLLISFNE